MVEVPITIACGNYDRTRAIRDGRVKVEGCAATYLPLYPEEIFFRAFRYQEFDVSELSFSSYIRTVAAGNSAYIGIPAFVKGRVHHHKIEPFLAHALGHIGPVHFGPAVGWKYTEIPPNALDRTTVRLITVQ